MASSARSASGSASTSDRNASTLAVSPTGYNAAFGATCAAGVDSIDFESLPFRSDHGALSWSVARTLTSRDSAPFIQLDGCGEEIRQHMLTFDGPGPTLKSGGHRSERPPARCHRRRHVACSPTPLASLRDRRSRCVDVHRAVDDVGAVGGRRGLRRRGCRHHPRHVGPHQVPHRMVDTMSNTRAERSAALERWADRVSSDDLVVAGTEALRVIAELAVRRGELDAALIDAVRSARQADRSWSEIGAMLGVSKQAAQRKYAKAVSH
jgi:hypothetical protein